MKKLTVFYLENCPYCRMVMEALEELRSREPLFAAVEIEFIEENACREVADRYDYYRVPSIFCGCEKLYECSPGSNYSEIKARVKRALERAVE